VGAAAVHPRQIGETHAQPERLPAPAGRLTADREAALLREWRSL
jgi:hypothetical protein